MVAISRVSAYAHLSDEDLEALGRELDGVRSEIEDALGASDAAYIRRTILLQRTLDVAARIVINRSRSKVGWLVGTIALATAKSIENMEIAHNVGHGQWDWMNDPEIHSSTWEWDMAGLSSQWRYSHNYTHHVFSNILGMDDDIGFGVLRVTRDQTWKPDYLLSPLRNILLAAGFEWGIALHGLYAGQDRASSEAGKKAESKALVRKISRQVAKEYLIVPALGGRRWRRTLTANAAANVIRNLWAYVVIFCGHFPDGAEKFDPAVLENETKSEWYLRQMLGSANFDAGRVLAFMSGQPVLPDRASPVPRSARQPPSSDRGAGTRHLRQVRPAVHDRPLVSQYLLAFRTIHKLALPDRFLTATSDDAPETASERMFGGDTATPGTAPVSMRRGLRTALQERRRRPLLRRR